MNNRPMKQTLIVLLIFISSLSFGQTRKDLLYSKIYLKGTSLDNKYEITGFQLRSDFSDTVIDNLKYRKFQTSDFTDYYGKHTTKTFYESFEKGNYCLLDHNEVVIHKINYQEINEQKGIIYGREAQISLEFIDKSKNFPLDSAVHTDKTPRRYYLKDDSEIYLVIIPELLSLVVSSNGEFYSKQLFDQKYNDITTGLRNNYKASTKFDINKDDEIQLLYLRKWMNDTTNLEEHTDKQFKNLKYQGDTLVNEFKNLKFEIEGYSYLNGSYDRPEELLVPISDSGYFIGNLFIPFKEFRTELKIIETENGNDFLIQGIVCDTINGSTYQKIIQINSRPYTMNILPFFPVSFVEAGNVHGDITYKKIKGVENGSKRERTYIIDRNNIRDIINKKKNQVEVVIYFIEEAKVEIEIKDYKTHKTIASKRAKSKKGINTFIIGSRNYEKNKEYSVEINYKCNQSSGGFSNSVKIKY